MNTGRLALYTPIAPHFPGEPGTRYGQRSRLQLIVMFLCRAANDLPYATFSNHDGSAIHISVVTVCVEFDYAIRRNRPNECIITTERKSYSSQFRIAGPDHLERSVIKIRQFGQGSSAGAFNDLRPFRSEPRTSWSLTRAQRQKEGRSEERRVGKECRERGSQYQEKQKR